MHEVFLKIMEDPARFRGASSPSTFLFGVATNLCLNRLRNRAARGATWEASVARTIEDGRKPGVDVETENRQLTQAILAEADPETAAIAVYHFVDGLSQGETADLVGRSRVTVNQRLVHFRTQARRRWEQS